MIYEKYSFTVYFCLNEAQENTLQYLNIALPFGSHTNAIIFTARKRSLGQGNIFTPVCHSVHRGICLGPGGWGCLLPGVPGGDPPDGYCCGRYASYWNAFLFRNIVTVYHNLSRESLINSLVFCVKHSSGRKLPGQAISLKLKC